MAKIKVKTHSGAKKRFKRTGTGKFKYQKTFKRHLLTGRSVNLASLYAIPMIVAAAAVQRTLMWIVTGVVSLAVYPVADSFALLARTGITGALATIALIAAAALDLIFGVATLLAPSRALWWCQITLIIAYTAIISWYLPEFWAHPYGPVLKNLPILAALLLLAYLQERRWNT